MSPLDWNADSSRNLAGEAVTRVGCKWRNFLSLDGWQAIDLTPREAGGSIAVTNAPYTADFPQQASGWATIESTNRYDIHTRQVRQDAAVGIRKRYPTAANVSAIADPARIFYPLAFPAVGADRLIQFHEQEVRDLIVFPAEPPGTGPVEIPFEIDFGALPILESMGPGKPAQESDFRSERAVAHGLSFTTGRFRGIKVKAPAVWDSALGLSRRRLPIQLVGQVLGTRFVGKKVIPWAAFKQAVYPVYADTTSTFYPDPDPETATVDGVASRLADEAWATIRGGAGNIANSTSATLGSLIASGAVVWANIQRPILLFDTAALGALGAITSAALKLFGTLVDDNYSDGIVVVASAPASNTTIATGDYETVGSTAFSSVLSLASFATGSYNSLALNAAGLAAIATGGITKLGVRNESDRSNTEPTLAVNTSANASFRSADQTGTDQDPYLEVITVGGITIVPGAPQFGGQVIHKRRRAVGY